MDMRPVLQGRSPLRSIPHELQHHHRQETGAEPISKSKAKAIRSRKAMKDADAAGREALELELPKEAPKEAERKYRR